MHLTGFRSGFRHLEVLKNTIWAFSRWKLWCSHLMHIAIQQISLFLFLDIYPKIVAECLVAVQHWIRGSPDRGQRDLLHYSEMSSNQSKAIRSLKSSFLWRRYIKPLPTTSPSRRVVPVKKRRALVMKREKMSVQSEETSLSKTCPFSEVTNPF